MMKVIMLVVAITTLLIISNVHDVHATEGFFNGRISSCSKLQSEGYDPKSCAACLDMAEDGGFFSSAPCAYSKTKGCIPSGKAKNGGADVLTKSCNGATKAADLQSVCAAMKNFAIQRLPALVGRVQYENSVAPAEIAGGIVCSQDVCPTAGAIPPMKDDGSQSKDGRGFGWSDSWLMKTGTRKQKCSPLHALISNHHYLTDSQVRWLVAGMGDEKPPAGKTLPSPEELERTEGAAVSKTWVRYRGMQAVCTRVVDNLNPRVLNAQTALGKETPLMLAIKTRAFSVAEFLFMMGADITLKDALGMTALDWAVCMQNRGAPMRMVDGVGSMGEIINMLEKWTPMEFALEKCKRDSNRIMRRAMDSGVTRGSGGDALSTLMKLAMKIGIQRGLFDKFTVEYRRNMASGQKRNTALIKKLCPRNGKMTGWNPPPEQAIADKLLAGNGNGRKNLKRLGKKVINAQRMQPQTKTKTKTIVEAAKKELRGV